MENLKNAITKTETLLNKAKLAKDKINETVVRGGGITSKSLSEIPDNINKMLTDNYKKIAIIDNAEYNTTYKYSNQDIPNISEPLANTKIVISNINLDFMPNFFIIKMTVKRTNYNQETTLCVDTRNKISAECGLMGGYNGTIFKENIIFNKNSNNITIYRYFRDNSERISVNSIGVVAIE